jgi:hypothetical protein
LYTTEWNKPELNRFQQAGAVVVPCVEVRRYRIEVGYGLEPILADGEVGGFGRESKKHFVGLTWANGDQKGAHSQCAVTRMNTAGIMAGPEGVSGKKAMNSDTMTVKN